MQKSVSFTMRNDLSQAVNIWSELQHIIEKKNQCSEPTVIPWYSSALKLAEFGTCYLFGTGHASLNQLNNTKVP